MNCGRFLTRAALILVATATLRLAILAQMPVIAKDGVGYCWNARALGEEGVAALHRSDFNQHPLFPLAILGVERLAALFGDAASPQTWQRAGQSVALASGLLGVALVGWLTARVVRSVAPPRCPRRVALWAMVIAGLLPLNTSLSVDVLSEPLFFVPYLAGAALLVEWRPARGLSCKALIVGVCAGLAFLVRPEGAAIGLGAAAVLIRQVRRVPIARLAAAAVALAAGFVVCAAPYWQLLGRFSPKQDKQEIQEFRSTLGPSRDGGAALLAMTNYAVYNVGTALLEAGRETFRAGRIVVVILALIALVAWRRRLLGPALVGVVVVATVHFALCVVLLLRHGYLDQRHTLAVVLLMIPAAAAALDWFFEAMNVRLRRVGELVRPVSDRSFLEQGAIQVKDRTETGPPPNALHPSNAPHLPNAPCSPVAAPSPIAPRASSSARSRSVSPAGVLTWLAVLAVLAPLALYSLRVPNGDGRYLRDAAADIVAAASATPVDAGNCLGNRVGLILGGSSVKRVAFYAGATYAGYRENAESVEERFADLRWRILAPSADWFLIEAAERGGASKELEANRALLDRLFADSEVARALQSRLPPIEMPRGGLLHMFRLWPRSESGPAPEPSQP